MYIPGLFPSKSQLNIKSVWCHLAERGMAKKAVVDTVSRKLVHIIYGALKSDSDFDADLYQKKRAVKDGICPYDFFF